MLNSLIISHISQHFRLISYGLDDENDDMANYLILSLQTEEIVPQFSTNNNFSVKNGDDYTNMEARINETMKIHNVTYLELLRDVAISCDQFIYFIREKSFGPDWDTWPTICGKIFSNVPILTPFGTCYTTHTDYEKQLNLNVMLID